MHDLKFNKIYYKLLDRHNDVVATAKLLGAYIVERKLIPPQLAEYDTDNDLSKIPRGEHLILLILLKPHEEYVSEKNIFTTFRKYSEEKFLKYKDQIGEDFNIVMELTT